LVLSFNQQKTNHQK